jgi:hypothetical protein
MSHEKQKLEVISYVGNSVAESSANGDKPPRGARLVAKVSWSWSPAHSACVRYLICTDRERKNGMRFDSLGLRTMRNM